MTGFVQAIFMSIHIIGFYGEVSKIIPYILSTVHPICSTVKIEKCHEKPCFFHMRKLQIIIPPQTVFVGGYTVFTLSDRPTVHVSVTFCFLNNFKNH